MNNETLNSSAGEDRRMLFGLPLDLGANESYVLSRICEGEFILTYLNPYSYSLATENGGYRELLSGFDCVVCDGIGVQHAAKAVFGISTPILSLDFSGIACAYLRLASERNMSVCMVGATDEVVRGAAERVRKEFPGITGVDAFCGFGDGPASAEEFIMSEGTQLVLAGMGMGLQEEFLMRLAKSGWKGAGLCVGGFFDKLANPQLDYQPWAKKSNLRFLGRLVREPRRLWRRYFIDYQTFMKLYFRHLIIGKRVQKNDSTS